MREKFRYTISNLIFIHYSPLYFDLSIGGLTLEVNPSSTASEARIIVILHNHSFTNEIWFNNETVA